MSSGSPYVFISYASRDRRAVLAVVERLRAAGIDVWLDQEAIAGGATYGPEIAAAIAGCAALVLMCTGAAMQSRNVRQEIALAWKYERPYLPLLLERTEFPQEVEYWLEGAQWLEVLDRPEAEWLPRVLRALRRFGVHGSSPEGRSAPSEPKRPDASSWPTGGVAATNLPTPLSSFIGRGAELEAVAGLLAAGRLVTLTGAAGSGKTRLAIEIGRRLLDRYADGVWLVGLETVEEATLVPAAVAGALGVRDEAGRSLVTTLVGHFRARHALLILDNCEHLIAACAALVQELVQGAPALTVLATSREPLRVDGEVVYPVPALSLPDDGAEPAHIAASEAVQLFAARAQAARPGYAVTEANAATVAAICRQLDGIPLALELAAARVNVLTDHQLLARLADRFRLLTGGSRRARPRQQTLRAAIDWSYALLAAGEQTLLNRLSVFAAGFDLDAAETVATGDAIDRLDIVDLLGSLAAKSLVVVDERDSSLRYRLLESVRQYAAERLAAGGEAEQVAERHRDWYLELAEARAAEAAGPGQAAAIAALEREHANLRAALQWTLDRQEPDGALRLVAAMQPLWDTRGHFSEGRSWIDRALALAGGEPGLRAKALAAAGTLAWRLGDLVRARDLAGQALTLYRAVGDAKGVAAALNQLGNAAYAQAAYEEARARYEESLAAYRAAGHLRGIAQALHNLGGVAYAEGDYEQARHRYEESLAEKRRSGDARAIANTLSNLGAIAAQEGDLALAQSRFEESLALYRDVGDRRGIATMLTNLANLAALRGEHERAQRWYEESLATKRQIGDARGVATTLFNLADLMLDEGRPDEAQAPFVEALRIFHDMGDIPGIASCLCKLAVGAVALGQAQRAARLFGMAEGLRGSDRLRPSGDDLATYAQARADVQAALGAAEFDRAWQAGQALSLDAIVAEAATIASPPRR